jgi:hypothetical protein
VNMAEGRKEEPTAFNCLTYRSREPLLSTFGKVATSFGHRNTELQSGPER